MIISTKKGTPKEELEKIVDRFEKQGLDVTLITGKDYNVFGLVGDTTKIDERDVLANPWIDNVTRVSAPYKRANRLFHPADSVIDCGGVKIGSKEKIAVMAGPCSIESAEQALRIAQGVKAGGATWGVTCEGASSVTKAVRAATSKPLIVKLTPNVTNITEIAKAVEAEGADSISMINTLLGMRIDIRTKRPILHNNVGGLSGPAIFPVAVRMVWQCYNAVKIPIIGMGGISTWEDAVEMMMAGASAIQMGTAIFTDPWSPIKVIEGLNDYMDKNGIKDLSEIVGQVKPWD